MQLDVTRSQARFCLLALLSATTACSPASPAKDFDFSGPLVAEVYADGGRVKTVKMGSSDIETSKLREVVLSPTTKWSYDLNTYTPHYRIVGPKININCWNDKIIVNYLNRSGTWRQISTNYRDCEKRFAIARSLL
jgi:hypothetical protein